MGEMGLFIVCGFVLDVLQPLPNRCTQQNSRHISKSIIKLMQRPCWKSDIHLFSYGFRKCMFVDFLTVYTSSPSCAHYWV